MDSGFVEALFMSFTGVQDVRGPSPTYWSESTVPLTSITAPNLVSYK